MNSFSESQNLKNFETTCYKSADFQKIVYMHIFRLLVYKIKKTSSSKKGHTHAQSIQRIDLFIADSDLTFLRGEKVLVTELSEG